MKATKQVTVGDLKNQTGVEGSHPILFCPLCMGEFSANSGDYFNLPANKVMECCGEPLQLVYKKTVYDPAE